MTQAEPRHPFDMSPIAHRRRWYVEQYGLTYKRPDHVLTASLVEQLDKRKSEEARRLLLGVSK